MSDIGSDYDAAVDMVDVAQDKLFAKEPDHPLVSFFKIEDLEEQESAWQKLFKSFSKNPQAEGNVRGAMECTYALAKYLIALEIALGERKELSS